MFSLCDLAYVSDSFMDSRLGCKLLYSIKMNLIKRLTCVFFLKWDLLGSIGSLGTHVTSTEPGTDSNPPEQKPVLTLSGPQEPRTFRSPCHEGEPAYLVPDLKQTVRVVFEIS